MSITKIGANILWMTVGNPKNHDPERSALRTAGIDMGDNTCYVHASLANTEEKTFYSAAWEGDVKILLHDSDLYIDTSWMKEEYPKYIEALELIEKRLNEQKKEAHD